MTNGNAQEPSSKQHEVPQDDIRGPGYAIADKDPLFFLKQQIRTGVVPGAALIATKHGKVSIEKCLGTYCGLTGKTLPLTRDVRHPFYSYSKFVSATVVVMAHQDGLIDYDTPVSHYLPEFTGGGKDTITLRHLLTPSAGIPNVALGAVSTEGQWEQALKTVCAAKTEWEPGSKTQYHALSGMFTAASVVRKLMHNRPWEEICRERLFDPIGAKSLTFEIPPTSVPTAITPQPKELPASLQAVFGMAGQPAGGCFGAIEDAIKVLQLHLNMGVWGHKRLLTSESLIEMHRVQYGRQIAEARAHNQGSVYEPWGLGPLMRGEGPKVGGHDWFGFKDQSSPGIFGHAGIDTVIGVADPATGDALFFVTTNSPPSNAATIEIRNGVTNRVFDTLK